MVHKFGYISKRRDLPSTTETWRSALSLMKTPADIQNIATLLEGCARAHIKVPESMRSKIIRTAAKNNNLQVVVECVKAPKRTGFKLNTPELVNELLISIQLPAINSGWDEAKTKAALKQTTLILNVLEGESHRPRLSAKGRFPLYRDPSSLAARLHLAAARAVHHQDGKDVDGKVAEYARELLKVWPEGQGLLSVYGPEAYQHREQARYLMESNNFLWFASPVLSALNMAAKVVSNGDLAQQLQQRAQTVEGEVKRALAESATKPRTLPNPDKRGEALYRTLFGPGESSP